MDPTRPSALLDIPSSPGRNALRGGLQAMGLVPRDLEPGQRHALFHGLHARPRTALFIDISPRTGRPPLRQIHAALPRDASRARVFLTRLAGAHATAAERRWVRRLGFADFVSGLDSQDPGGALGALLAGVASALHVPAPTEAQVAGYTRLVPDDTFTAMPWRTVRTLTGLDPEALVAEMHQSLDIRDRSWRMRIYPQCFTGTAATDWLERRFRVHRAQAVQIGEALGQLGLVVHVLQEHPFRDEELFFRIATSPQADAVDLGAAAAALLGPGGVQVADRSWRGTPYPQCWIGSEAVDRLCSLLGLGRHDAWIVLQRLEQFGLFEHVSGERPMIDGHFFYRFTDAGRPAA